jgi:hypothetical protein
MFFVSDQKSSAQWPTPQSSQSPKIHICIRQDSILSIGNLMLMVLMIKNHAPYFQGKIKFPFIFANFHVLGLFKRKKHELSEK